MTKLTPKQYLSIMLDSHISADFISGWLMASTDHSAHWNSLPMLGRGYQIKIVKELFGNLKANGEPWPAVCTNCRKHLGVIEGGELRDTCATCRPRNSLTDSFRAAARLQSIFKEAGIKTIAPICIHLAETPVNPTFDTRPPSWEK